MPTTRSKAKQSHIEDFTNETPKYPPLPAGDKRISNRPAKAAYASSTGAQRNSSAKGAKRKQAPLEQVVSIASPPEKKSKVVKENPEAAPSTKHPGKGTEQSHFGEGDIANLQKPIIINRAPVLQLWGATVTSFLYPNVSWSTCLSAGNAISSLCAISKGKAIGMIEPQDENPEERAKRKVAEKEKMKRDETMELEIMGFPLHVTGEEVLLSGKGKPLKEGTLKAKFGGERPYDAARKGMTDALDGWKSREEDLNKRAFHMYEQFRPEVAAGQQGWGRKGELNLGKVDSVARQ